MVGSKIYIALCCDRHQDPEVGVFTTLDKAIIYAKKFIEENARFPEEIDETIYVKSQLYRASYSQEGDYVEVFEGTLDP